jgi:diacylglycerol kinase family enzyme
MLMRIALVINATSGSMADLDAETIREKLQAAGFEASPETDSQASLPERLEAAAAQPGIEAVVVAGGDGSMACAAAVMAGRDTPLGLLPLGTMNLLAKDLGLPIDLDEAIAALKSGAARRIDVAEVNGHVFLISSMLGLPATMGEHREAQRGNGSLRGVARFVVGLGRHLWRYPRLAVTTIVDGAASRRRVHMLVVVNNDFVEKPGKIIERGSVDAGELTLYVAPRLTSWRMARLAAGMAAGWWHRLPGLERRVVGELTIESDKQALRVMNDGEIRLIETPLRYAIRPRALAVIVPKPDEDRR